jgi:hypothetical protein
MSLLSLLPVLLASACVSSDDTGVPVNLPDTNDSSSTSSDSIDWNINDTGMSGGGTNESPPYELALDHKGHWDLLPLGGPYTSMVGEMTITELLDGNKNTPWCEVTFSLTGQSVDDVCETCDFGFLILFYVSKEGTGKEKDEDGQKGMVGGLEDCRSPDLPGNNESRTLAYSDADSTIYYNYHDSDIWIPWYDASDLHDEVNFEWEALMGFIGEQED